VALTDDEVVIGVEFHFSLPKIADGYLIAEQAINVVDDFLF